MRFLISFFAVLVLFAGWACSGDSVDPTERRAAEVINAYLQDPSSVSYIKPGSLLNLDKHKSQCVIGEGSTTGIEPMRVTCEWSTSEQKDGTQVDLIETWKCSDFNKRAGRDDFCKSKEGRHHWRWVIDAQEKITYLGDTGDAFAESFYLN